MKRKLFTLFLITCLLCQILPVSVFAFTVARAERFEVQIVCDDTMDLSGIELMIYEEIEAENTGVDSETVHENYSFSVYTDSTGLAQFELPEKRFSVNLNLKTLPNGYGADTYTRYYGNGELEGSFAIAKVEMVELVKSDTGYTVAAYAENGFPLTVDAEVTVMPAVLQAATPNTYLEYQRYNSTAYQVTANYGGKVITERVTEDLSTKTAAEKSEYLYEAGFISESEHIRVLCEQFTSSDDWDSEAQCCGTTLTAEITAYAETMDDKDPNYEIIASVADSIGQGPEYVEEYVYRQGTNTFFRIHYGKMLNENGTEIVVGSLQEAINLNSKLEQIKMFFCTQMGLSTPLGHIDGDVYDVYIVHNYYYDNALGITAAVGTVGNSYICLKDRVASTPSDDISSGIIAHEFSHAIMDAYRVLSGHVASTAATTDGRWMHESFASFFGSLYSLGRTYENYSAFETAYFEGTEFNITSSHTYVNNITADQVNNYLNSMHLSLNEVYTTGDYAYRHYGSMLFPLYLYETDGGIDMIKQILTNYAVSRDPLLTIDSYGLSFEDHYADYCAWVYDLSDNCQIKASGWRMVPDTVECYSYPTICPSTTAQSLSCVWRQYSILADGNPHILSITTTISGYNTSTSASVITRYLDVLGNPRISNYAISAAQTVSIQRTFGTMIYDYWTCIVNNSMDNSFSYSQAATIS
jgi:hypothetical protein